jgi:hypothetical protein
MAQGSENIGAFLTATVRHTSHDDIDRQLGVNLGQLGRPPIGRDSTATINRRARTDWRPNAAKRSSRLSSNPVAGKMRAMPATGALVGTRSFARNSPTQAREPIADETTIPAAVQETACCKPSPFLKCAARRENAVPETRGPDYPRE